jgi:hypothetical protein
MKITEFLKRHSLINSKFIDDFYSFYDEGQNEYDHTIDLEKLAYWLELRKDNLKVLLAYTYKLYSMNKLDIPKIVLEKN